MCMLNESPAVLPQIPRQPGGAFRVVIMTFAVAIIFGAILLPAADAPKKPALKTNELYGATNVWTAHFTFTKDQWKAMEPSQTGGRGAGGRGPGEAGGIRLLGPEGGRNGLAAARGLEFDYVHADLEFAGRRFTNVAARYKGNGTYMRSQGSLKRPLKADLNGFVQSQKLAEISKLNFHNNVADPSWMNESLSYRLYREAGVPAPRNAYAKVYLTVSGVHDRTYLGLYSLMECVDNAFAQDRFGTKQGAIFKPVTRELFSYLGDDWEKYQQIYDAKTDLTAAQHQRVIDFGKLVSNAGDAKFAAELGGFLDLEAFARFMAVTVYLSTFDSLLDNGQNFYVYLHPQSNKFQFIPWDLDHSFGQFTMVGTQEQREQLSIKKPWPGENRFLDRVFKVEAFQKAYRARLEEFSKSLFRPERFHKQVDELAAALRDAVEEESADKLTQFDKVVAGETVANGRGGRGGGRGGRGGGGGAVPAFDLNKPVKPFVTVRAQSITDQLAGKSEGLAVLRGMGMGQPRGDQPGPGARPEQMAPAIPGLVLAPVFFRDGDQNRDAKLSQLEFLALGEKWFTEWDKTKSGALTGQEMQAGVESKFAPPEGDAPPGAPGPGPVLGGAFMNALDGNQSGIVSKTEYTNGFANWFKLADADQTGALNQSQLGDSLSRNLTPPPPGRGRGFRGGNGLLQLLQNVRRAIQ